MGTSLPIPSPSAVPAGGGAHFTLAMVNAGLAAIVLGSEHKLRAPKPPRLTHVLAQAA